MVKTKEELIAQITAHIGSDTSDNAIALMEDVSDTLSDYEAKAKGDGTDWKSKYEENDKEWREKYISRFSEGGEEVVSKPDNNPTEKEQYTYEKLFEVKEK